MSTKKTKIGGVEFDFDQAFATAVLATIGVSIVGSLAGLWGYRKGVEEVEEIKKEVAEAIPFNLPFLGQVPTPSPYNSGRVFTPSPYRRNGHGRGLVCGGASCSVCGMLGCAVRRS